MTKKNLLPWAVAARVTIVLNAITPAAPLARDCDKRDGEWDRWEFFVQAMLGAMIKVNIRSYDIVTAALPEDMRLDRIMGKPIVLELEEGTKVVDIFKKLPWLGRPFDDTILIFVNGQAETLNYELKSDDTIDLMTPSGGG